VADGQWSATPPVLWDRVEVDLPCEDYVVEQVSYPSKDGTGINMFLSHHKDVKPDGNHAYASVWLRRIQHQPEPELQPPHALSFSNEADSWPSPTCVAAARTARPGTRPACLIASRTSSTISSPARSGLSLRDGRRRSVSRSRAAPTVDCLLAAVLTQRPELFQAVVCQVPLLDMIRYHHFLLARLWIPEYGSPDDPQQFPWLWAYSPYHRVKNGVNYPAVLLATAESDTRVDAMHARKMAARLAGSDGIGSAHPAAVGNEGRPRRGQAARQGAGRVD